MTDDRFMHSLQEPPRPEFARELGRRLQRVTAEAADAPPPRAALAPRLALAFAAVAVMSALFLFPGVRASAQAFLDLFRVQNFVAVSFDPSRIERLDSAKLDLGRIVGDHSETLVEPGAPRPVASAAEAGAATGLPVRVPTILPRRLGADTVWVQGEGRVRVTASAARLRDAMDLMNVRDLSVPAGLDGAVLEVHVYPLVRQMFRHDATEAFLVQSRSPEVSLPANVQLAQLGEIALRMLGMEANEARGLAGRIDWKSTMLVPVPTDAGSFREVTVQGQKGLLVTRAERVNDKGRRHSPGSMVLWSEGPYVFAAGGNLAPDDVLALAESAR
jgi:hypothetical protein